jgi:hypothetical protein
VVALLDEHEKDMPTEEELGEDLLMVDKPAGGGGEARAVVPLDKLEEDLPMKDKSGELAVEETGEPEEWPRAAIRTKLWQPGGWPQAVVAVLAALGLMRPNQAVMDFVSYYCSNSTNRVDTYSCWSQPPATPPNITIRRRGPSLVKLCR